MDIKEIVRKIEKELRDYCLRKRKHIDKPTIHRLPLKHRKCTYAMLKAKYPVPTAYYQNQLIRNLFQGRGRGRSIGQATRAPSRRSRST